MCSIADSAQVRSRVQRICVVRKIHHLTFQVGSTKTLKKLRWTHKTVEQKDDCQTLVKILNIPMNIEHETTQLCRVHRPFSLYNLILKLLYVNMKYTVSHIPRDDGIIKIPDQIKLGSLFPRILLNQSQFFSILTYTNLFRETTVLNVHGLSCTTNRLICNQ